MGTPADLKRTANNQKAIFVRKMSYDGTDNTAGEGGYDGSGNNGYGQTGSSYGYGQTGSSYGYGYGEGSGTVNIGLIIGLSLGGFFLVSFLLYYFVCLKKVCTR